MLSTTTTRYAIIMAIYESDEGNLNSRELKVLCPEMEGKIVDANISSMTNNGMLERKGKRDALILYALIGKAKSIAKTDPSKLDLVQPRTIGKHQRKGYKAPAEPEIPQFELNYSPEANQAADYISNILQQNAGYRDLLMQVYTTIGKSLGIGQGENNNEQS